MLLRLIIIQYESSVTNGLPIQKISWKIPGPTRETGGVHYLRIDTSMIKEINAKGLVPDNKVMLISCGCVSYWIIAEKDEHHK